MKAFIVGGVHKCSAGIKAAVVSQRKHSESGHICGEM